MEELWNKLDEMAVKDPETYAKLVASAAAAEEDGDAKGGLSGQGSSGKGVFIAPDPGLVLKMALPGGKGKLFVNVCSHERIEPPVPMTPAQAATRGIDLDALPASDVPMRYPLSSGELREAVDKSGKPCKVWDVVLNPLAVDEARAAPDKAWFIAQLVLQTCEGKHALGIDLDSLAITDVKFLKNRKYWDLPVRPQYIADRAAERAGTSPAIITSEVAANEAATGEALLSASKSKVLSSRPNSTAKAKAGPTPLAPVMDVVPGPTGAPAKLVITIDVSAASAPCVLSIAPAPQLKLGSVSLDLPFAVDGNRVMAQFDRASTTLTVRMPVVGRLTAPQ
ncbi:uncharacterized protein AMSG_02975 [Thecamonas trahens ATCC 50062]|uniref:PIH1 domain-containing protein 1 n=1 Tax=Thecamonas trahens ATCC 50062 TaxID=461836 RepID=A0A0L0D2I9_THETB|nr:hypothetical protein AMSG_02975 [Thecamonas trahens ATCC 50062]KNC46539.1 hypothetical protein AMSG_02975 [Thecamonas trahens ATCC 50062]|eukprot:XP_013760320.1 hypothetical protein AMSG_02975 [Thecamonas trahens ATCC 50062]